MPQSSHGVCELKDGRADGVILSKSCGLELCGRRVMLLHGELRPYQERMDGEARGVLLTRKKF